MKMLGFMIALTIFYWVMSSYAQTVIAGSEPCPASLSAAIADHDRAIAAINRRVAQGNTGEPAIVFEISPKESEPAGERLASLSPAGGKLSCGG